MSSGEERRLALLSLGARAAVLLAVTVLDIGLMDYDSSKTIHAEPSTVPRRAPEVAQYGTASLGSSAIPPASHVASLGQPGSQTLLSGWVVWDSVFFVDIAARGYVYEQYYAFFPLLPWLLSLAPSRFRVLLALALNAGASMMGTVLLYRLGMRLTRKRRLAALACLFFIFNPATIFHAAPYTEAAFAAATLAALYWLHCRGRVLPAMLAVMVSCGLRSNGVVNAGYLGHFYLSGAVAEWPFRKVHACRLVLVGLLSAAISVSPLILFQWAGYRAFCATDSTRHGAEDQAAAAAAAAPQSGDYSWPRPWCSSKLPYVYGFVQSQYWNVGFLRYYTLQQLPNFLLAAPVLLLSAAGLAVYCTANARRVLTLGLAPLPRSMLAESRHLDSTKRSAASAPRDRSPPLSSEPGGGLRHRSRGQQHGQGGGGAGTTQRPGSFHADGCKSRDTDAGVRSPGSEGLVSDEADGGSSCNDGGADGYLRPELAVFMYPWAFSLAVALTTMHVQVATRFLLSACPPVYWFMAHVWLRSLGVDEGRAGVSVTGGCAEQPDGSKKEAGEGKDAGAKSPGCLHVRRDVGGGEGVGRRWAVWGDAKAGSIYWPWWCGVALWRWCLVYIALGCVLFVNFMPWT